MIDRHYFRSVYFREPSGVLFEIATIGPGFTVDEPLEHLGEKLSLTPQFEHLREQIEPTLTPLRNPRESWTASSAAAAATGRAGGATRSSRRRASAADRHRREVLGGAPGRACEQGRGGAGA